MNDFPRCWVEIDIRAFEQNLNRVRELTPSANVMAVIKADAYGHGMMLAAKQLETADEFAVTSIEDVEKLHACGVDKPLTLLSSTFDKAALEYFSQQSIRPVIYDYEQLAVVSELSAGAELDLWVKVDTGMGRLGFDADELLMVCKRLQSSDGVGSISLMTHLANADVPTDARNERQISAFRSLIFSANENGIFFKQVSMLNSAGVVGLHHAAFDIVRPGVMLYGISPTVGVSAQKLGLKPVMSLKSKVISVRRMAAGSSIGYGGTYTLDADSRIAYIACGYGDGYPRHAPNGTTVSVNGFLVPLVGRVSMDMIAVDIGELPVQVGDIAVLWGEENPIEEIALSAGTIAYELTCGVTRRVKRRIVGENGT